MIQSSRSRTRFYGISFSIRDIPMNGLPLKTISLSNNVFAIVIIFRCGEVVTRHAVYPVLRSLLVVPSACTRHDDATHRHSLRALSYSSDTIRVPVLNKNSVNLVEKLRVNCLCCAIILIGISWFYVSITVSTVLQAFCFAAVRVRRHP